jgi:hypothetical protein
MAIDKQIFDPDGDVTLILEVVPDTISLILDGEYGNETGKRQSSRAKAIKVQRIH